MKTLTAALIVCLICGANCFAADETVRAVQTKLKVDGFYAGETNGEYTSDTAAAVTRFQIRNGLQISGTLDDETKRALGVATNKTEAPTPKVGEDVWRYLRKSDQEYLARLMAEKSGAAKPAATAAPPASQPESDTQSRDAVVGQERLQDFVGAFVLAGLDPRVGSELEFFADRVDYFDEGVLPRERIRRSLEQYDRRWPQRRFRLAGALGIEREANGRLRVTFPLRYELRRGAKSSAGTVRKTLVLERAGDDLQIVAVRERRSKP